MSVPYYLLFLAAVCITVRALFGLLELIDAAHDGAGRVQTPPRDRTAAAGASTPYDWERDA